MKILIYDTSAADVVAKYNLPFTDTDNWPQLAHLSWILIDETGKELDSYDAQIKPSSQKISQKAANMHGLDKAAIEKDGIKVQEALRKFNDALAEADYVFSHNMNYNSNVMKAEYFRTGVVNELNSADEYCLMQESTYFCKLPAKRGDRYKWPTLTELHKVLFQKTYANAQNALADRNAASRCFIVLYKMNELQDIF